MSGTVTIDPIEETKSEAPAAAPRIDPLAAYARGAAGALRHLGLAVFMWAVNLLVALPLALGLRSLLGRSVGASTMGERLRDGLSYLWLTDFTRTEAGGLSSLGAAAGWVALGYVVVSSLVAAGAIETLAVSPRGFRFRAFFEGVARRGASYLLLLAVTLVAIYGLVSLIDGTAGGRIRGAFEDGRNEGPLFWAGLAVGGLTLLAVALTALAADYAKVRMALDDSQGVLRAAGGAVRLLARRPSALAAALLCTLTGAVVYLAYLGARSLFNPSTDAAIVALFALQQVAIVARMWVRLLVWSTCIEVVRGSR